MKTERPKETAANLRRKAERLRDEAHYLEGDADQLDEKADQLEAFEGCDEQLIEHAIALIEIELTRNTVPRIADDIARRIRNLPPDEVRAEIHEAIDEIRQLLVSA